jgi:hypothetical protein
MAAGLMYVDERTHVAYFCEKGTQGDDWSNRRRSYNAGIPDSWRARVLFWAPGVEFPADYLSVDQINAGAVAWLSDWADNKHLHAAASVEEFQAFIAAAGGQSFVMEEVGQVVDLLRRIEALPPVVGQEVPGE